MCHICEKERQEQRAIAEQEQSIRIVCICNNLLGRKACSPGEIPATIRAIGPCCKDRLPRGAQPFVPSPGFAVPPDLSDERNETRLLLTAGEEKP